ncbi:MAG: SURF1 family protein [Pseudomonadota bacterium]
MSTTQSNDTLLHAIVPWLVGALLFAAFIALGLWQLDRAGQKEALNVLFADDAPHRALSLNDAPAQFERIELRGRLLGDRQVLIDNIVRNGRIGYFVITPLETGNDGRLLLINRGWIPKTPQGSAGLPSLDVSAEWRQFQGRAGQLPRVGVRPGDAFAGSSDWPRTAVYPNLEDVAAELDRELFPFVLLMDEQDTEGFQRVWKPDQSGPMTHYGYAFQWFAMALALAVIGVWQFKKRRARR